MSEKLTVILIYIVNIEHVARKHYDMKKSCDITDEWSGIHRTFGLHSETKKYNGRGREKSIKTTKQTQFTAANTPAVAAAAVEAANDLAGQPSMPTARVDRSAARHPTWVEVHTSSLASCEEEDTYRPALDAGAADAHMAQHHTVRCLVERLGRASDWAKLAIQVE